MAEPYGGYDLPPECVPLLDGGDALDPDAIGQTVTIDLCRECAEIASRMVHDYDTSPLPECDAEAAHWADNSALAALAEASDDFESVDTDAIIADALATVQAHRNGHAERALEHEISEAYVIVYSLAELGKLDADFL